MSAIIKEDFRDFKKGNVLCVLSDHNWKKSLLIDFNSSPTFFLIPLFIIFTSKKISQLTKIFLWWNFCCLGNYCRFLLFFYIIASNLFDARLLEHRLFGIFVKLRRLCKEESHFSSKSWGTLWLFSRKKENFFWIVANCILNCQSGNSSARGWREGGMCIGSSRRSRK